MPCCSYILIENPYYGYYKEQDKKITELYKCDVNSVVVCAKP